MNLWFSILSYKLIPKSSHTVNVLHNDALFDVVCTSPLALGKGKRKAVPVLS
jgi:hypothetical protein